MKKILNPLSVAIVVCIVLVALAAHSQPNDMPDLRRAFNLAGVRSREIQYYVLESKLTNFALDGTRIGTDIFRLHLKCVPAEIAGKGKSEYTCVRFTIQQGDTAKVEIPGLTNWTYTFDESGLDEREQVFGIDHGKFENLVDSQGNPLPFDKAYHVYNAFIDFHAFCNVFAEPTREGKGVQNLRKIGQKIVHAAAFSEAPTNLGKHVAEGSFFKNGEITLVFKGLSLVDGSACALIGYDSGESSFKMIMKPMPEMEIQTVGSSHYMGEIYKNLSTNWVQKATMTEYVVSETTIPMSPNKIHSVVERNILIVNLPKEQFSSF